MDKPLLFYSTNLKAGKVTFSQALLQGQAPDKGLYMPVIIPQFSLEDITSFTSRPYYEIAYEVSRKFLIGEIADEDLMKIVRDAYDFKIPLEPVLERKYVMRLDQGPTASFKDFAARMMARLMQYHLPKDQGQLLILTATSGDTGSAVASAFHKLDFIQVVVLFPRSEVTGRQRKQMTTLGENVHVLALDAKFDDCQALVKQAFADPDLNRLKLSSANSINIGRLIPQIVYYFYAYAKLKKEGRTEKIIFSVPSGNFGDMMGGVMAMKMGLPVERLIIATNENDEFPRYMETGDYHKIEPSRNCISSAMNVGHPSNLARLLSLYGGVIDETGKIHRQASLDQMKQELFALSINDDQTRKTISEAYRNFNLILEPHGAVGWAGLMEFLRLYPEYDNHDQLCVSLETAHPAKFPEEIHRLIDLDPILPKSLDGLDGKKESYEILPNAYPDFKDYLIKTFSCKS